MSKFPISFTLHLPLSHASFFPFPTSTRHQRDERQKGLTWLTLLGRGVVPSGLTGCLLWFAVGCACVCVWGVVLGLPPTGNLWMHFLGGRSLAFSGPVPALCSLTFPGGPTTENPSYRRLLWGSGPVLGKIHTFDPLWSHFLLLLAVIHFLWMLSGHYLKFEDCWRPGCGTGLSRRLRENFQVVPPHGWLFCRWRATSKESLAEDEAKT